ncbi:hypothetical protein [Streptomyces griseofuscus]|uniref:hypothetical protein n=1 Tax=Streptomyces griseofuscus TaxID=146922 RepID=UPI003443AC97
MGADGGHETRAVAGQERGLGQLLERPVAGEGEGVLAQFGQGEMAGPVKYLPTRVAYSTLRPRLDRSAEPLGASPLAW